MSGRGRGRGGRGRSGAPASISQQFLLRSAQEAGFDVRNLRALNSSANGQIFPDLEWHSSGERRLLQGEADGTLGAVVDAKGVEVKIEPGRVGDDEKETSAKNKKEEERSPQQISLISKSREMHHKFQTSTFYVRTISKEVPDVIRYSDRLAPPPNIDSGAVLSHCLGGRKRTRAGVFVPEELCGGQRRIIAGGGECKGQSDGKKMKELNLEELAKKIRNEDGEPEEEEKLEGDGEDVFYEEDGEESDGADYEKNYYESEGDESAGSDGEPTF
ncbi:hypothetical protein ACHAXN_001836 [Cyclotella atomus]|jgi:hypothetical protein